jgi:tetratricopeptide (TPR) repeat protein
LIVASGLGAYKFVQHRRSTPRVWDVAATTALIDSGKCQEALATQINAALRADATDPEALALKQRCAPPALPPPAAPPPTEPVPPAPDAPVPSSKRLDEAEASIAANACQSALDTVNVILANDPGDERARSLAARASACLNPAPAAARPAASDATKIAVVDGVAVKQGESKAAYQARVADLRKQYQDAITALRDQRFADALKVLDALPQGYRDVPQQRAAAQGGVRDAANRAYAAGRTAEQQQEWTTAIRAYQRARDLDDRDVSADLTRITEQKTRIGQQACKDGQAQYLYGRNSEAAAQFQKAIELLPPNDPCYTTARDRLAAIRK